MGRLEDARSGYEELLRRDNENPQARVQFGDFLVSQLKDRAAAIEAYRQALIWRPDDEATRSKLADIYIAMGMEHYARQEWAAAQARFVEAEKYVSDRNSPQGLKIQDHQNRLREIRRPR
jgi:tetratricopeptide (TPR) repeat protein